MSKTRVYLGVLPNQEGGTAAKAMCGTVSEVL